MPTRPEEAARLKATAAALGVDLTEAQLSALLGHLDLLQRWNQAYNLTAVRDREAMLVQHLFDCLAVVAPLRRRLPAGGRLLDVGSGGGLPGAVIAIAAPEFDVTSIDAVAKKAAFMRQAAGELGLGHWHAVHQRVEELDAGPFDAVVARAFSSLSDLVRLTERLLAPEGVWAAMKGKVPTDEIGAVPASVDVFHVEQLQVPELNAERCIVWMKKKLS